MSHTVTRSRPEFVSRSKSNQSNSGYRTLQSEEEANSMAEKHVESTEREGGVVSPPPSYEMSMISGANQQTPGVSGRGQQQPVYSPGAPAPVASSSRQPQCRECHREPVQSGPPDPAEIQKIRSQYNITCFVSVFVCLCVQPLFGLLALIALYCGRDAALVVAKRYRDMAHGFLIGGLCIFLMELAIVILVFTITTPPSS